ncbi:hypothetical protein RvY_19048 [Ramazzottius varieornatus]|uniref:G-protein coupled receptors family 1 profile domain-containing protein n=1 Tax=Ramazzottius varieornatus TaxID=947166 RepID=A0A1D1W873_RAMVA|nr:hypothetical protein RvY_19048 [Ramazzottius varieornatus]
MANYSSLMFPVFSSNFSGFNGTKLSLYAHDVVFAYWLISVCGLIGLLASGLLLTVVIRQITTRNSGSQILVANLVLTYVLTSIFMALEIYQLAGDTLAAPTLPICRGFLFSCYVFYAAGMWTDVCLGINRVVAIFRPHQYARIARNSLNYFLSVMCWVISIGLVVPIAFNVGGNVRMSPYTRQCEMDVRGITVYVLFCLFTVLPYSLVSTASTAVIIKSIMVFRSRNTRVGNQAAAHEFQMFRRRLHVAKMLLTSFIWASTCQLPSFLAYMFFKQWMLETPTAITWFNVLLAFEFVGNPLIFFAMSQDYRRDARRLLVGLLPNNVKRLIKASSVNASSSAPVNFPTNHPHLTNISNREKL